MYPSTGPVGVSRSRDRQFHPDPRAMPDHSHGPFRTLPDTSGRVAMIRLEGKPVIDTTIEQMLTLHQAAALWPSFRQGKPVTDRTIRLWIANGVKLPNGEKVRLEAVRVGGRRLTSREALQRFVIAQNPTTSTSTPTPAESSPES